MKQINLKFSENPRQIYSFYNEYQDQVLSKNNNKLAIMIQKHSNYPNVNLKQIINLHLNSY
jgi:hypothetical protein